MRNKLKRIFITNILLLGLFYVVKAQNQAIKVTCERNGTKGYNFSYTKETEGSYVVFVKINDANNLSETEFKRIADGHFGFLYSLNVNENNQPFGFSSYSISYLRGVANPKIDTSFVYAMPFRKGAPLTIYNLTDLREKYLGETPTRKMKAFEFSSLERDTACAIRKGIVVSVIDKYKMDTTTGISYTSSVNSILIEHPDGTLASYSGFKKGSIFVEEGQSVFPFTPLGMLAHYDISKKHELRLSVYFLADTELTHDEDVASKRNKRYYEYINPYFLTDKGVCHLQAGKKYSVGESDFVIEHEMTKKELKAIGKKSRSANNLTKVDTKNDLTTLPIENTVIVKDTIYSDDDGNDVSSMAKASHYSLRWTDPANEHRKIINIFYLSGKLKEEFFQIDNPKLDFKKTPHWYYKDKDTRHLWYMHGLRRVWYESGQLRREVEFQNGEINGRIITYWDNGAIKRTNRDSLGNTIPTKCFDRAGKEVPVYPFATTGKFNEGKTTLNDYLNEHIVYPKEAIEKSIEGSVEVVINIQPDGNVGNIRTIKSDQPLLEAEVKRVIKTMPKWSQGTYDGEPVAYSNSARYLFKLPIEKIDWSQKLNKQDTTYYDKTGKLVNAKRYADCYELLLSAPDDSIKAIERIYSMDGKMLSEKYFLKANITAVQKDSVENLIKLKVFTQKEINRMNRKIEGRYREWYDNGQLGKDFYVEKGKKNANLNFYWENGSPRRKDVYNKGELLSGECYDKAGGLISYFEADMPATFKGGNEAMTQYLKTNLQYPPNALKTNKQGSVIVKFIVNNIGFISRAWIPKSLDRELDKEAFRLIYKMPKWFPEFENGEPVSSVHSVAVNFVLQ